MLGDTFFRWLALALFSSFALGFYYRIKAAKSHDQMNRKEEGMIIMLLLRLFGFSLWIALVLYLINPAWMAWASLPISDSLRWVGVGTGFSSVILVFWMLRSLGNNITDTVSIRKEHQLITNGPYRYIRHPLYSFTLITVLSFSLICANAFLLVDGILTMVFLFLRTPIEERKLIDHFGDAYIRYMNETPRFFPRLSHR